MSKSCNKLRKGFKLELEGLYIMQIRRFRSGLGISANDSKEAKDPCKIRIEVTQIFLVYLERIQPSNRDVIFKFSY